MSNNKTLEKIEEMLLDDTAFQHILKFAPTSQRPLMTFELARYFHKLLAQERAKADIAGRIAENEHNLKFNDSYWATNAYKHFKHRLVTLKAKELESNE